MVVLVLCSWHTDAISRRFLSSRKGDLVDKLLSDEKPRVTPRALACPNDDSLTR
jgi:hypothetical protein